MFKRFVIAAFVMLAFAAAASATNDPPKKSATANSSTFISGDRLRLGTPQDVITVNGLPILAVRTISTSATPSAQDIAPAGSVVLPEGKRLEQPTRHPSLQNHEQPKPIFLPALAGPTPEH